MKNLTLTHLKPPVRSQPGNPEQDYYLDIIYKLEYRAYDALRSQERNNSGKIGNTKGNRWKQSSAEFFNSLAKQARDWLEGNSSFPNPWSFKQWQKIRSIFKDTSLMPYQDKIDHEKDTRMMDELRRKAKAYDALTNGQSQPDICTDTSENPDWNMVHDLDDCYL